MGVDLNDPAGPTGLAQSCRVSLHGDLAAWCLEDHLVLVELRDRRFHVYNPAAAVLWLLLLEGRRTRPALIAAFAEVFGKLPDQVERDMAPLLADWRDRRWVVEAPDGHLAIPQALAADTLAAVPPELDILPGDDTVFEGCFQWGTAAFGVRIGLQPGLAEGHASRAFAKRLVAMLAGLPAAEPSAVVAVMQVVGAAGSIVIRRADGSAVAYGDPLQALDAVISNLLHVAHPERELLLKLHAAASGLAGAGALVMPAVSGSGKSTLSAYLAASGWDYLGDDIVGLSACGTLLPLPTAASLKEGSWPVLSALYPQLDGLPSIEYGAKVARYLPLPAASSEATCGAGWPLRAWVFPSYQPGAACRLERIGGMESLRALLGAGICLEGHMSVGGIDRLLELVANYPSYRMVHSNMKEAEACLHQLLTGV